MRVGTALPRTETFKVLKRQLSAEGTDCADPVHPITPTVTARRDDIATMLLDRLGDQRPGLRTRERDWTWDEVVRESAARAVLASALRDDCSAARFTSACCSTTCRISCSGSAAPRWPARPSSG